jgi:hypothetical protein
VNCGACGKACPAGEACQGGTCRSCAPAPCPVTLASGQFSPDSIAVDATHVYRTNNDEGTVMKVPLAGGTPVTLAVEPSCSGVSAIAVDATSVYWTNSGDGTVMKLTPK